MGVLVLLGFHHGNDGISGGGGSTGMEMVMLFRHSNNRNNSGLGTKLAAITDAQNGIRYSMETMGIALV